MNYKLLAKLFTSSEISRISQGDYSIFQEVWKYFPNLSNLDSLEEVFEEAYKLLCKNYPNEYVVKNTIANNILIGTHSMNTASMLSELRIGTNKADCVIINGLSTCYEIKTQFDSLKRLPEQLEAYTNAFDKTYVVTHKHHLEALYKYQAEFPKFGIILANEHGRLSKKLEAPLNTSFNIEFMFHTLRKDEYTSIAREIKGKIPDVPATKLFDECKEIFCSIPVAEANQYFKKVLKHHRKNDDDFINLLPRSMKNLGISYKLHRKDKNNILSSLVKNQSLDKDVIHVLSVYERQAV